MVAIELRASELKLGFLAKQQEECDTDLEKTIQSALRRTIRYSHDRDIRLFPFFLVPAFRGSNAAEIRVIEIASGEMSTVAHVSPGVAKSDQVVYAVAFQGHLLWAKQEVYTNESDWRLCGREFDFVVRHTMADVESSQDQAAEQGLEFTKCPYCPELCRLPLGRWSVGRFTPSVLTAISAIFG